MSPPRPNAPMKRPLEQRPRESSISSRSTVYITHILLLQDHALPCTPAPSSLIIPSHPPPVLVPLHSPHALLILSRFLFALLPWLIDLSSPIPKLGAPVIPRLHSPAIRALPCWICFPKKKKKKEALCGGIQIPPFFRAQRFAVTTERSTSWVPFLTLSPLCIPDSSRLRIMLVLLLSPDRPPSWRFPANFDHSEPLG